MSNILQVETNRIVSWIGNRRSLERFKSKFEIHFQQDASTQTPRERELKQAPTMIERESAGEAVKEEMTTDLANAGIKEDAVFKVELTDETAAAGPVDVDSADGVLASADNGVFSLAADIGVLVSADNGVVASAANIDVLATAAIDVDVDDTVDVLIGFPDFFL